MFPCRHSNAHQSARWIPTSDPFTVRLHADGPAGILAEPFVFPAYIRPTLWKKSHFLVASKLPCLSVQRGAKPMGVWVVLQSLPSKKSRGITLDANTIVRSSVRLAGVLPVKTALGNPVTHYRVSLNDLAVRFPAPYATVKSRMIRATGSYRVPTSIRDACFVSLPQPTCAGARARG